LTLLAAPKAVAEVPSKGTIKEKKKKKKKKKEVEANRETLTTTNR